MGFRGIPWGFKWFQERFYKATGGPRGVLGSLRELHGCSMGVPGVFQRASGGPRKVPEAFQRVFSGGSREFRERSKGVPGFLRGGVL